MAKRNQPGRAIRKDKNDGRITISFPPEMYSKIKAMAFVNNRSYAFEVIEMCRLDLQGRERISQVFNKPRLHEAKERDLVIFEDGVQPSVARPSTADGSAAQEES